MSRTKSSQPDHGVRKDSDVPVEMRDGTVLYADVYQPDSPGEFPVLIERTPYGKSSSSETSFGAGEFYASRGYVTVIQDVRGRFSSEGDFYPFRDDGGGQYQDGYDTVEWAAAQPWSNGKVGTIGGSYSGVTQYRLHESPPPHLAAQFVRQSSADYSNEWVYRNGVFELGFNLMWATKHTASHSRIWADSSKAEHYERVLNEAVENLPLEMKTLPLNRQTAVSELAPWWIHWLEHPESGAYWDQFNITPHFRNVQVPVHHLGGWYDGFLRGTIDNFTGMRSQAKTQLARDGQRLTIGPWVHAPDAADSSTAGAVDFGEEAAIGFFETRLRWFDRWMKNFAESDTDSAPVKVFTMGINRWSEFAEWPPANSNTIPYYLTGESSTSSGSLNDGGVSENPPGDQPPDQFEYDPMDPVPTLGGSHLGSTDNGVPNGPMDQRPIHSRVLTYTGHALNSDLNVTGEVRAVLFGRSSARDTDWVVKLVDVHPDGKAMLVCDGVIRARYRNSRTNPELLNGLIERYQVDLWATSHVFKESHRLQVIVTSSDFPRWERNMNTGGVNAQETEGVVARNEIFHDPSHASHILLPVLR